MASIALSSRLDKEKRIKAILAYSSELNDKLLSSNGKSYDSLITDLEKKLTQFPQNPLSATNASYEALDSRGTTLWNTCLRLKRQSNDVEPTSPVHLLIALARVYAFLMLDCAHSGGKGSTSNLVRLMKVGLKTAKNTLELKKLDIAVKTLERTSTYNETLKSESVRQSQEIQESVSRLEAEYFIVRTALAWRQDRLDVADQMFRKAFTPETSLDPDTAESLADTLFEMGADLLQKKDLGMAIKWLERAYDTLMSQELEKLTVDASELRISIMQSLARANIGSEHNEGLEKAHSLIELMSRDFGDKLVVLLLRLELLSASSNEVFDSNAYGDILHRMARTIVLTDSNLELILAHVQKLYDKSPSIACKVLDDLLQARLVPENDGPLLEKVLIMRIWMATRQRESSQLISSISTILDFIKQHSTASISPSATSLVQTLFWKRIESNYTQGQIENSEAWCKLALHCIFDRTGEMNVAKLQRKLLLCALARDDVGFAREVYQDMTESTQNFPITRFLLFKVAVRSKDHDLAMECLDKICKEPKNDIPLLDACVIDAQQFGDTVITLAALQRVLEAYDQSTNTNVHLPALLRTIIRLLISELEKALEIDKNADLTSLVSQVAKIFAAAAGYVQKSNRSSQSPILFSLEELDWFSKNAYNLAIKHCTEWEPREVLHILDSCTTFINSYPSSPGDTASLDLALRSLFCYFLASIVQIALARSEDNVERQLQDYLNIRKHTEQYDKCLTEIKQKLDEVQQLDLVKKLSILLAYDFEAAVRLKAWDSLNEIIEKAIVCNSMRVYEIFGDCVLSSDGPSHVVINTLKKIVNEAWSLDEFDIAKLSRYMRCLFQFALAEDVIAAEKLLDQVQGFASEAFETAHPYPSDELEWIVTTAFNHAVDLYCGGDDAGCRVWAGKALNTSNLLPDNGALHAVLEQNFMGLKWEL